MASEQVISALESLHRQLEKLEPAIKHVEIAQEVTQTVKTIPGKHIEFIEDMKTQSLQHKNELTKLFRDQINELITEHTNLSKVTKEILSNVQVELEAITRLKGEIKTFHGKVEGIRFPERLDKLDANVAGLMAAVQSVHGRVDGIERNLSDRLKELFERQKEDAKNIQVNIATSQKAQKITSYITWGILVVILIEIIFKLK
jgi:uncharacterized phage infection (PIP) family protein YhgE